MNDFYLDNDICCEFSEIRNGTIKSVDMSPNNTFDREVKTLTQHPNSTNTHVCFSYEPIWYDHGHFARCQVQAKSIYIKKARREIVTA